MKAGGGLHIAIADFPTAVNNPAPTASLTVIEVASVTIPNASSDLSDSKLVTFQSKDNNDNNDIYCISDINTPKSKVNRNYF